MLFDGLGEADRDRRGGGDGVSSGDDRRGRGDGVSLLGDESEPDDTEMARGGDRFLLPIT